MDGWAGFGFMKKLKFVIDKLKVWNKKVLGDVLLKKKEILNEMVILDVLASENSL